MDVTWEAVIAGLALLLGGFNLWRERSERRANADREQRLATIEEDRRLDEVRGTWSADLHVALVEQSGRHYWRLENVGRGPAYEVDFTARRADPDGSYQREEDNLPADEHHLAWQVPESLRPGARLYLTALVTPQSEGPWRVVVRWSDRFIDHNEPYDGRWAGHVLAVEPYY